MVGVDGGESLDVDAADDDDEEVFVGDRITRAPAREDDEDEDADGSDDEVVKGRVDDEK